jgi:hypothetical protein
MTATTAATETETPADPQDPLQSFIPSAATENSNPAEVRYFLKLLRSGAYELRTTGERIWSGYYDDMEALAGDAIKLSGSVGVDGVFHTINTVNPILLARSYNKMKRASRGESTSAKDILRRVTFLVDIDSATRSKGICATDAELVTAKAKTTEVRDYLRSLGWPEPLIEFSGNGYHLRYLIDLPNDDASTLLLESCLKSLAKFTDASDKIDQTVFDPPRICKISGTMNAKGDHFLGTPDNPARPHRLCKVISEWTGVVSVEQLKILAALAPTKTPLKSGLTVKAKTETNSGTKYDWSEADVEALMSSLELEFDAPEEYGGGLRWRLAKCPFNPEHTNPDSCFYRYLDKDCTYYWVFGCSHDTCQMHAGRTEFTKIMREKFPLADWKEPQSKVEQTAKKPPLSIGDFSRPKVHGTEDDFVIPPVPHTHDEGWFPQSDTSLVASSSGGGKTTVVVDMLDRQSRKEPVFGHPTRGLRFLVLMADRGDFSFRRTMKRLKIDPDKVPIKRLGGIACGQVALTNIKDAVESCIEIPEVLFIEGADMLLEDAGKMQIVAPFLTELQKLARHYHIAIILSVGTPKMSKKDFYAVKRDQVFGSVAWSRMSETIVILAYMDDDAAGVGDQRCMAVLLRHGPTETFDLIFEEGKLVLNLNAVGFSDDETAWMMDQKVWFSVQDVVDHTDVADKTVRTRIKALVKGGILAFTEIDQNHKKMYIRKSLAKTVTMPSPSPEPPMTMPVAGGIQ